MDKGEFLKKIHRRVAQTSVGSSAIRNQGASGLVKICRNFFEEKIDLMEFRQKLTSSEFAIYLDSLTNDLTDRFPKGGQSWGAARKGLNLFFRDVVYNKYLADHLEIPGEYNENLKILKNLEVPLDRDVATGLIGIFKDLPKWKSIKLLNPGQSIIYQNKALQYSDERDIARIHLDLEFWRS